MSFKDYLKEMEENIFPNKMKVLKTFYQTGSNEYPGIFFDDDDNIETIKDVGINLIETKVDQILTQIGTPELIKGEMIAEYAREQDKYTIELTIYDLKTLKSENAIEQI